MDILFWLLLSAVIFWLPAGYLGARIVIALNAEFNFNWEQSVSDQKFFGLGVLLGGVAFLFAMSQIFLFLFLLIVNFSMDATLFFLKIFVYFFAHPLDKPITFLGRFAPKN